MITLIDAVKKYFQEVTGTAIGGLTGYVSSGADKSKLIPDLTEVARGNDLYGDWIYPMIMTLICSLLGLLVTHFGKKGLKKWKL
jgi:hypothetical protein